MEVKLTIVVLVALALLLDNPAVADFFFNHPLPKFENLHQHNYKCVPGRTIIKITDKEQGLLESETDSDEYRLRSDQGSRRTHTMVKTQDECCQICVCSADGKNEHCSKRPANNVNECLMIKELTNRYSLGVPYEHTRSLSFRMRRDYLWHNDEIPYQAKAKCYRGHSYYSNSMTANDTDIDIATDITSLLDYANENICFYCICSVDGTSTGCIHRDVQYCNFFRVIRNEKAIRDRYTALLQQDRPTYFRQLSWRLRRTMDSGIYDLIKHGGDTLCCNHPDGHRRQIHNEVRNKLRTLKRRLPKENLLGGSMRGDYVDFIVNNDLGGDELPSNTKCVPFVSEYSNCNDDNACSGCTKCSCTSEGQWSCQEVKECLDNPDDKEIDDDREDAIFDNALMVLENEMDRKKASKKKQSPYPNVPSPQDTRNENLLGTVKDYKMYDFLSALQRSKRSNADSVKNHAKRSIEKTSSKHGKKSNTSNNNTIMFYDTVDELNEDTLKNSTMSGTLPAKKMDMQPKLAILRRSGDLENASKSLQIEYNQPKSYNQITDNKIDVAEHENKFDASHENLKSVLGNHSQQAKDKDLSKIVVNELKRGSEIIGDIDAPVTSNITFTPENDTLTAMAFIAGNLLNKLWNMEKDASGSSMETDAIKHQKITDLLDLFKEPLNLRQETFLKNALEHLSSAIDKDNDIKNISFCENIEEAKKILYDANSTSEEDTQKVATKAPCKNDKNNVVEDKQKIATVKAISKINTVLDLIRKFENIQISLSDLKHGPKINLNNNNTSKTSRKPVSEVILSKDETKSLNLFGSLLEKITNLLMPSRNYKKIVNQIKNQNLFGSINSLKKKFKKLYNIDLTNMTVTAKDKLILDYLTHIDGNPDCLMKKNNYRTTTSLPNVEGNILLNLSEFFKMKSFTDLIQLLEPEKHRSLRTPVGTTEPIVESTTMYTANFEEKRITTNPYNSKIKDSKKFNSTKEKLKAHLRTIIEDLIELQNSQGVNIKGNIKVADALPCLYNVFNAGREEAVTQKVEDNDPRNKMANIFYELKKEFKVAKSRRSSSNSKKDRPKSAAIWERVIKNLNEKSNANTRRLSNYKTPKSYNQIKEMMDRIENASATYKHIALLRETPAAGKLMMLTALEQDVKSSINVLEEINLAFKDLSKLPADKFSELEEFIENIAKSINLNDKVNEKVKSEPRKYFVDEINSSNKILKTNYKKKPALRYSEVQGEEEIKISRAQILNQLMKNCVNLFLKMHNGKEYDLNNNLDFDLARRLQHYLDVGDYDLAKDMYKLLKEDNVGMPMSKDRINDKIIVTSTPKFSGVPMRRMATEGKEAPIDFEEQSRLKKQMNWVNQDHLIKQLLNIKNMGL